MYIDPRMQRTQQIAKGKTAEEIDFKAPPEKPKKKKGAPQQQDEPPAEEEDPNRIEIPPTVVGYMETL